MNETLSQTERERTTTASSTSTFAITNHSLLMSGTLLSSAIGYSILLALTMVLLYPTFNPTNMSNISSFLTGSLITGMLGSANIKDISGFAFFLGIYFYNSFNDVIYAGLMVYIGASLLPMMIENGTLDLVLARTVSRLRCYLGIWLAVVVASVSIMLATILCVWIASLFISKPQIDWQWLWITQAIQGALFFMAGGLGLLFGAAFKSSRVAAGSALGLLILTYLSSTVGGMSDHLNWLLKISPFYYAPTLEPLVLHQFTWWYPWLLVVLGLVFSVIGLVIFKRQDLPAV